MSATKLLPVIFKLVDVNTFYGVITNKTLSAMIRREVKSNKVQKHKKHSNNMIKLNKIEEDMMLVVYGIIGWVN